MIKKLILVRHGETDLNRQGILQGQANTPLNDAGIQQARKLAQALQNEKVDEIWVSPLQRTLHTAEEINVHHGKDMIRCPAVIERCFGVFEGKPVAELCRVEKSTEGDLFESDISQGESLKQLYQRAERFVQQLKDASCETLLVVSHSGFCRPLLGVLLNLEFEQWFQLPQQNACMNTLIFDCQGEVVAHQINEHTHIL